MKVFLVHAHHEPTSFNASLTREALHALGEAGHEVVVSDLYAMNFDPVSDRRNFLTIANPERLDQQQEELHAIRTDGFVPELRAEMDKLVWCNTLIMQFPLWWLGPPAILKGWLDRVLALGFAYGGGRWFDGGVFRGKRALCSMTIGGPATAYASDGMYLRSIDDIMHPLLHGTLAFVGFDLIAPFWVHAPGRLTDAERRDCLARYRERVLELDAAPLLPSLRSADYERFVRKPI